MTEEPSDAALLRGSGRDPDAFHVLYTRWAEPLITYCYRRTLDPEAALELTAETFATAYARRDRYREQRGSVGAWLYGIARNEIGRFRRRRRRDLRMVQRLAVELPVLDAMSAERVEALVDAEGYRDALAGALATLTARERDAVRLRVIEQLDYHTVASRLACSEQAARVRVHRGLGRLAAHLEGAT